MQDGNITAGFNALNQSMYIWSGGVGWTYFGYDPLGRCVKRWKENGATSYLYYDGWNLIQEGSQSRNAERQYVHGARMDEVVAQITPPNNWIRYFHYDANGNCTLQTDGWGNIAEQYDYDAFGQPYFYDASGNNIGYSPWGNRFLFTGREWLSDLKLYDYRNRLYQPELGRFLQPDPKEFAAGDYNLYRYCHNDPVNKSDPFGDDATGLDFDRASDDFGYNSFGGYLHDVGQVFIGEAKGAAYFLSGGVYQPSYTNTNQQLGGYVGQGLAVIGSFAAARAGTGPAAVGTNVRPQGIPKNWTSSATRTEGGTMYRNPTSPNETVRVMPGNSKSPYPNSQKPYVRQTDSSGKFLDANGKPGGRNTEETHIPLDKFRFRQ